ncbi:MAG: tetratricopeptide repeat protein [Desulfomonilaceae bacterium]
MAFKVADTSFGIESSDQIKIDHHLPEFPTQELIKSQFPELFGVSSFLGKSYFDPWVEFTLEHPDEIWEKEEPEPELRVYYYITFFGLHLKAPVFVVEVSMVDDFMELTDYSLLLDEFDIEYARSGVLVYSAVREYAREKQIRSLNDKALKKYEENKLEEARDYIDSAIRLSGPSSAYLFNNRGLICWKMGRIEQAKQDFLASIGLDRENADPYFNIGLIYLDEAEYRKALLYLKSAVELNPSDSQFLTELGHLYLEMDREQEALRLFRRAHETNPNDAQVDFHLGYYFLYKKREPNQAVKYYKTGLKKDPHDQFALADLAVAYWINGARKKTEEVQEKLMSMRGLAPYTVSRLVYLNMEMGAYEQALNYYHQAMHENDPFEPEWLHYNAALVYARTGRDKLALDVLGLAVRAGGHAVIEKAMSERCLSRFKQSPDFKKLLRFSKRRHQL